MNELFHILLASFNIYATGLCIRSARLTKMLQQTGLTIFLLVLTTINFISAVIQFSYMW